MIERLRACCLVVAVVACSFMPMTTLLASHCVINHPDPDPPSQNPGTDSGFFGSDFTISLLGYSSLPEVPVAVSGEESSFAEVEQLTGAVEPIAYYNPRSGNITFEHVNTLSPIDITAEESYAGILLGSEGKFIAAADFCAIEIGGVKSEYSSTSVDYLSWTIEEPSKFPSLDVGEVVVPGTSIHKIAFMYFGGLPDGSVDFGWGQMFLIPEPTTAGLLLTCLVPAVVRRRR